VPTPPPDDDRTDGLSRRSALGLIAAMGAFAAGCKPMTVDRNSAGRPTPHHTPQLDPDVALAASALAEEQNVLDVVVATRHTHQSLRGLLADAQNAHRQHLKLLMKAVPSSASAAPDARSSVNVPSFPAKALMLVIRREEKLAEANRTNASSAQSGGFAELLASMAASATQHGAALHELMPTIRGAG
jgi:hypothetical protein